LHLTSNYDLHGGPETLAFLQLLGLSFTADYCVIFHL